MQRPLLLIIPPLLLCSATAAAAPASPAPIHLDVDGDGRPEQVTTTPAGLLIVARGGAPIGQLSLGEGASGARLEKAPRPYLALRGSRDSRPALLLSALIGDRLEEVYRGPIGPVGRDGEYAIEIEIGAEVRRYQTAPGIVRCDGERRLFAERHRPGVGWQPLLIPVPTGRRLLSRSAPPPGLGKAPLPLYRASAASAQPGVDRADLLTAPRELEDGRSETAWRVPGDGRGAWVTLRANGPGHFVRALRIAPATGPAAAPAPRTLAAILADGQTFTFDLAASGPQWIELPAPQRSPCVSLVLIAADPGAGLGEVAVYSELDAEGVAGLVNLAASADPLLGDDAQRALLEMPPSESVTIVRSVGQVLAQAQGPGRRRIGQVLAQRILALGEHDRLTLGAQATALLLRTLAGAGAAERATLFHALLSLPDAAEALGQLISERAHGDDLRTEALQQLGLLRTEAAVRTLLGLRDPLFAEAARPLLRSHSQALVVALRCLPFEDARMKLFLAAVIATGAAENNRDQGADLMQALGQLAACPDERLKKEAAATITRHWPRSAPNDRFSYSYRVLQALGQSGVGSDPAAGEVLRQALRDGEPELRRAATVAAALLGPAYGELALRSLADPDAGVRLAALAALTGRRDEAALLAIEKALGADPWPQVRRSAAEARAGACPSVLPGPRAADALRRALKDPDGEVQRAALSGIARCEGARAVPLLAQIARSAEQEPQLRAQACALLARLQGPAATQTLTAVLAQVAQEMGADERQTGLAIAALRALGRAAGPRAVPALVDILGDNGALDAAAYEQIASLCKGPLQADVRARLSAKLAPARRSEEPRLRAAATTAARRCGL